jgi:uracil-DNA glycosylase
MPIKPSIKPCSIFILGDAPGKDEELLGVPFIGASGQELQRMLKEVGIAYDSCSVSNVFLDRPIDSKIENFCVKKAEAGYDFPPPLAQGKYFRKDLLPNRERVYKEIESSGANIVLALGNTATWCLLDKTGISAIRGTVLKSPYIHAKVIPCYHPAAILRNWELRHTTIVDLQKAKRESAGASITYDEVSVIIEPSLQDLSDFYERAKTALVISFDIETKPSKRQILCIGFGLGSLSLVCPFADTRQIDNSYWRSIQDETSAWRFVRAMLSLPQPKITQNGMYDITWLWAEAGIKISGNLEDTMLFHHSMFPEMTKGLDFLGSIYANLPAWKDTHRKKDMNKKED